MAVLTNVFVIVAKEGTVAVVVVVTTRSGAMEAPPRNAKTIIMTAMIENQGLLFVTATEAGWVGRRETGVPHDAQNFAFGKS